METQLTKPLPENIFEDNAIIQMPVALLFGQPNNKVYLILKLNLTSDKTITIGNLGFAVTEGSQVILGRHSIDLGTVAQLQRYFIPIKYNNKHLIKYIG